MIHLVAAVDRDVALCVTHDSHKITAVTPVATAEAMVRGIEIDRPRSVLLISANFITRAAGMQESEGDWCIRLAELDVPVILACSTTSESHDILRALSALTRVEVWHYQDADARVALMASVRSASAASLSMAAWHAIRLHATNDLDDRIAAISRALFRLPCGFSRTLDVANFGLSVTWYNALLRKRGLQPFSVLRRTARVLHAWSLHAQAGASVLETACASGCGSVDTLSREVRLLAGVTPGHLFSEMSAEYLIDLSVAAAISRAQPTPRRSAEASRGPTCAKVHLGGGTIGLILASTSRRRQR